MVYATDLEISICYLKLFVCVLIISLFVLLNILPPSKDIISVSRVISVAILVKSLKKARDVDCWFVMLSKAPTLLRVAILFVLCEAITSKKTSSPPERSFWLPVT